MRCPRLKISKEKFWKILNWSIVPILGSVSYVFISEAWNDYRFGRTNMSFDQVPIEEQPTITMCVGNSNENRISMRELENVIYHYSASEELNVFVNTSLQEGENEVPGGRNETIHLRKMRHCISIKSKIKMFNQKDHPYKIVKITFPNEAKDDKTNIFRKQPLRVFFTTEENSYSLDSGHRLTEGDGYEVRLRIDSFYDKYLDKPNFESNEPYAYVYLKPISTKFIKEKSGCREKSAWENISPLFEKRALEKCGSDNACLPYGLPNSKLKICDKNDTSHCSLNEFKSTMFDNAYIIDTVPCEMRGYSGSHDIWSGLLQTTGINTGEDKGTTFVIIYMFKSPMRTKINEEYYVVPTLDLIGVIGGTLSMVLGFSFYGAFDYILTLSVVLVSRIVNQGTCRYAKSS